MEENENLLRVGSRDSTLEGYTAHLEVQGNATPRLRKPRSVPYALLWHRRHEHAVASVSCENCF